MGGVAGHLSHLTDNLDFTFGEIKSILRDVASAEIEAVEKVDGQNLFFSVDPPTGEIRTARNKGDINKGGMTPEEYKQKWANHFPSVRDAFMNGFEAISRAVQRMSPQELAEVFGETGNNYVNAEIMYTGNPNIINYNGDYIVVHNLHEFDDEGKNVGVTRRDAFQSLVSYIEDIEGELDAEQWGVSGPRTVELQNIIDQGPYEDLVAFLDSLGVADDATLADFADEKLLAGAVGDLPIPVNEQQGLIDLILGRDEAPTLASLKKGKPKEIQTQISAMATKTNKKGTISKVLFPIELAISDFAVEVLRGMKSFFVDEHDSEVMRIKDDLEAAASAIESYSGDDAEKLGDLLDKQMAKLKTAENVASSMEGIVFEYPPGSEELYKLTGAFAMVNQIVGRARRLPAQEKIQDSVMRNYVKELILSNF